MPGPPSATRRRCSTSSSGSGSATPRSPKYRSRRSPPKPKAKQVTARLIVRRVRDQPRSPRGRRARRTVPGLAPPRRVHRLPADPAAGRGRPPQHAIIEQVIADLKNGPLAHLPSGRFNANAAWLVLSTIAFNLTRAAGALASRFHARATTATIRRQLINVPARPVRSARRIHLRLPTNWPWADDWIDLFTAALGPPATRFLTIGPQAPTGEHVEPPDRPAASSHPEPPSAKPKINTVRSKYDRCIRA